MSHPFQGPREHFDLHPHKLEKLDADTYCIRWGRKLDYDTVKGVLDFVASLRPVRRPMFMIIDVRHADIPEQRARRLLVERTRSLDVKVSAVIGGNVAVRTIMNLMLNVMRLMGPEAIPRSRFFDQEEPALAWLMAQRNAGQSSWVGQ